jgi:hypothetical protein
MSKILVDESVATNITAVASGGDNTDGCDDIFGGCIEYRAKRRVKQTRPSVNSKERVKSENETWCNVKVNTRAANDFHGG